MIQHWFWMNFGLTLAAQLPGGISAANLVKKEGHLDFTISVIIEHVLESKAR